MQVKNVVQPNETSTHYTGSILQKLVSTSDLKNCLDVGSKKRLTGYQKDVARSKGTDHPCFDDKLRDLLSQYVYSPEVLNEVISYLNNLRDKDGYLFSRDLKLYSKTEEAMERFAEEDYSSFRWNRNYIKTLKDLREFVSSLKLTPERYFSDKDIEQALPKVDTHSGYTYILTGRRKKGECIEGIYSRYKVMRKKILDGENVKSPILIGFRTQASGEIDDDGSFTNTCKHKTRIISMYDIMDIVLELQFANPFQSWMNLQHFYAGGKNESDIMWIISAYSHDYRKFISIDYSSFDQTISSWLIRDAFSVVKSAFILSEEDSIMFDHMVDAFVNKDFLLSEGVLHSHKGVPSGSRWTQIIDSLVNILVVRTYFNSIGKNCEMIAMGDDNAIFCDEDVELESLASYISKNFGLVVKTDDKSNEGLTHKDSVKFLSRYWRLDGAWRHPNQLISRLLFPERRRDYSGMVKPQHVLFAYILTYKQGMSELMDVNRFLRDFPISRSFVMKNVDSRYVPGSLAYIREYT